MSTRPQFKVTEKLRKTWAWQRVQALEERTHTQDGTPRDADGIAQMDWEIAVIDKMLSLPLGSKFNGQDVQEQMERELGS